MANDETRSERAPKPVGAYPHARRVGNLLFLSGIGSRKRGVGAPGATAAASAPGRPDTHGAPSAPASAPAPDEIPGNITDASGAVISHDIVQQTHQVMANVRTILEDAGSSWDQIVDVTVFLTDMENDFAAFNRVYAEYFTTNQPTRTTVEVGALPTAIAIELKIIATV